MKVKIVKFGSDKCPTPFRAHANDCGADVYSRENININPGDILKLNLGFGLEIPDGYAGFIFPRSGLSSKGIVCELPPIDSGYRGPIHAIVSNVSKFMYTIKKGERIGQLVIMPVVIPDFVETFGNERGTGAFGSSGAC